MKPYPSGSKSSPSAVRPSTAGEPSAVKPSAASGADDGRQAASGGQKESKYKLTIRVSHSVAMGLKLFCAFRRRRIAEVVEAAVSEYLSRQDAPDDYDDDASHSDGGTIINLYRQITGNKWRRADWKAYKRVRSIPPDVAEMAMLMAYLRAPNPIRSFAYFVPEILNPDYAKVKATADYLGYLWKKVRAKKGGGAA